MVYLSGHVMSLFRNAEEFIAKEILKLDNSQNKSYFRNRPGYVVSEGSEAYAAFNFSKNPHFILSTEAHQSLEDLAIGSSNSIDGLKNLLQSPFYQGQDEYIDAVLAMGEEIGHAFSFIVNPEVKKEIYDARNDREKLDYLLANEERKAREIALAFLNYLGITAKNRLWSTMDINKEKISLYNNKYLIDREKRELEIHHAGYTAGEINHQRTGGCLDSRILYSQSKETVTLISKHIYS